MKTGSDRKYTPEFRQAAVKQVLDGGRSMPSVARSLEMSPKTLANWVLRARKGQPLARPLAGTASTELEAEVTRLRQENAKLRLEKEIWFVSKNCGRVAAQAAFQVHDIEPVLWP
jgi:transposase